MEIPFFFRVTTLICCVFKFIHTKAVMFSTYLHVCEDVRESEGERGARGAGTANFKAKLNSVEPHQGNDSPKETTRGNQTGCRFCDQMAWQRVSFPSNSPTSLSVCPSHTLPCPAILPQSYGVNPKLKIADYLWLALQLEQVVCNKSLGTVVAELIKNDSAVMSMWI